MAIADPKFRRLTLENVERVPRKRGVYALYADRTLVCLGLAAGGQDTLRSQLRTHLKTNAHGATVYKRETTAEPQKRLKLLLAEHVKAHGRPPVVNAERV